MATLSHIYSDLDLTFALNPATGDVAMSYDAQAVVRSIRNLLQTNFNERPMQPSLGSNMDAHLFEQATAITASNIETEITNVIQNFEPRATIQSVNVVALPDKNMFYAECSVFIGNQTTPTTFNLLLERTR